MNNMKKQVILKAIPGDIVNVSNYRRGGQYENGEVYDVETKWRNDGNYRNEYRVCLDRRSAKGNYLFIYVGDKAIDKI